MEAARSAKEGELHTPLWVKAPFLALCLVLDVLYVGKPIQVMVHASWAGGDRYLSDRS